MEKKRGRGHDLEFIALKCGETGMQELVTLRDKLEHHGVGVAVGVYPCDQGGRVVVSNGSGR